MRYLILLLSSTVHAGTALLSWSQVTQYTNHTTILDPVTYSIYQGKKGQANKPLLIAGLYSTTYSTGQIAGGRRLCWNVRAVVKGHPPSILSNEVCKWITKSP